MQKKPAKQQKPFQTFIKTHLSSTSSQEEGFGEIATESTYARVRRLATLLNPERVHGPMKYHCLDPTKVLEGESRFGEDVLMASISHVAQHESASRCRGSTRSWELRVKIKRWMLT